MYTLWVCSLLVIPPPIGRTVPQGGFPTDLTELNLSGWANLVQDVVVGLQALLPRLCLDLGTQAIALLQLLEVATGVGFCHHCCHSRPHCTCTGASQPALPTLWSQIVQQAQGCGVTSSSGGVTDPSTPSGFLHLEHTSSGGPSTPRATCIPIILASHREGHLTESRYRQAGSGAEGYGAAGSNAAGSKVTSPTAAGSSGGATLVPATPILWESASNPIPAGGAAAK